VNNLVNLITEPKRPRVETAPASAVDAGGVGLHGTSVAENPERPRTC
jgi:hypothetical protein